MDNERSSKYDNNSNFVRELTHLINRHSLENLSNTPDFILAEYLVGCLENYDMVIHKRERWYGRINVPGGGSDENLKEQ